MKLQKTIHILIGILTFLVSTSLHAQDDPVVIVSSTNPNVERFKYMIEAFNDTYAKSGCKERIVLENMNCEDLSGISRWKSHLREMLAKYYKGGKQPKAIVLLGPEASSTYLSLKDSIYKQTPIILGLRSNNIVELPDNDSIDLSTWKPQVRYCISDYKDYNIVGGNIYSYDIEKNIHIINEFYPHNDSLIFISDNTLSGITMQAHFRETMKKHKEYDTQYVDGRTTTLLQLNETLPKVSPNHVIVIGTWRIDKYGNYNISNSAYMLAQNAQKVPTITLSDEGRGQWAFAGYTPHFSNSGSRIANALINFLRTGRPDTISFVPSGYFFDDQVTREMGIDLDEFDEEYELINEPETFWDRHPGLFTTAIVTLVLLTVGLTVCLYYLRKNRRLRKRLEVQSKSLETALAKAEEANRLKSQFISSMSHEIRTPLNAVVGFSQLLTTEGVEISDEEKRDISSRLVLNSNLLLKLIGDILDLSRIDAGKGSVEIKDVEFVELMKLASDSAKVDLKKDVEILCTSSVEELHVKTDKARITQVFTNLLSNAKKCTQKGTINVSLDYKQGDEMLTVMVSDTGCGIPADKAELIFQRFEKLDEFSQGTGLGLPITRAILEQLGGSIWVDTTYTEGARFVFTHPVKN